MKSLSKIALSTVAIAGVIILFSSPATTAVSPDTSVNRSITLTSEGTVKVIPDAVKINATVTVVKVSSTEALAATATTSEAVRASLRTNGVATKDIATQSISIYPEYDYANNTSKLIGYRASQSFVIVVRKASDAGNIVDGIVSAGGDNVRLDGVSPFITNFDKATLAARALAVSNIKEKAKSYESLLNVKLGKVQSINENSSPTPYPPIYYGVSKESSTSTTVDLGEQNVTVSITVQWGLS